MLGLSGSNIGWRRKKGRLNDEANNFNALLIFGATAVSAEPSSGSGFQLKSVQLSDLLKLIKTNNKEY